MRHFNHRIPVPSLSEKSDSWSWRIWFLSALTISFARPPRQPRNLPTRKRLGIEVFAGLIKLLSDMANRAVTYWQVNFWEPPCALPTPWQ
jgi:hypothetical protein